MTRWRNDLAPLTFFQVCRQDSPRPGANVIKPFFVTHIVGQSKLDCLPSHVFRLAWLLRIMPEPTYVEYLWVPHNMGRLLGLLTNIALTWKSLGVANTMTYLVLTSVTKKKCFVTLPAIPDREFRAREPRLPARLGPRQRLYQSHVANVATGKGTCIMKPETNFLVVCEWLMNELGMSYEWDK
jgi:hypothetical protein